MLRTSSTSAFALFCLSWMLTAPQAQTIDNTQKKAPPTVIITDADNGKDIDLPQGGLLEVRLKSDPSTGYSWAIKGDPGPLKLVKSSAKRSSSNGKVGAPGTQEFRFSATSAGMASLNLEYRRPWEYTAQPVRTFQVRVNAR